MEGFSIRVYTEKMRSVNFEKCWPFDRDGEQGETGRSLPPILSRKYKWWSDELQAARLAVERPKEVDARVELEKNADERVIPIPNNESMIEPPSVEPPVDGNPGEAAEAAAAVEKEGKQVRVPARGKQRAPKKRSIVELFAVAPPIDTLEDDANGNDGREEREEDRGDGEEGDQEVEVRDVGAGVKSGGESFEALRKRTVLDVKDDEKKQEKVRKYIKEKKGKRTKKKKLKAEIRAAKEEKINKSKMSSSVDISHRLQNKLHDKKLRKIHRNLVDGQKKSVTAKSLPKKHNFKLIQTSKLISRNQKEVTRMFPLHSILKNRKGGTCAKKGKTINDAQGGNYIKLCCKSAKRVSFSGKDDILGLKKRCCTMQLPHLQNLCKIFSDVLAASSAMDNLSKGETCPPPITGAQVVNARDKDLSRSDVEMTDGTLSEEKQLSHSYDHAIPHSFTDPSKRKSPETKRTPLSESVDLNHSVQDISELSCFSLRSTMSPTHAYSGDPKVLNPIHEAGSISDAGTHGEESSQMMSNVIRNPHGPIEKCGPRSTATSSVTVTRNPILQHSPSCLEQSSEASKEQHLQCVDPTKDFCSHRPGCQPVCHHSPEDFTSRISSSVRSKEFGESRLISDMMSTCKEKSVDKDFIGLPLNSQGELMQLHSNTKFVCTDFYKKQNLVRNSVCSFPVPNYVEPKSSLVKMKGEFPCASWYQKDPLNWSLEQYYPAGKVVTSGLGFTDLQGFEIMEIQNRENQDFDQITHCDTNQMEVSCGCTECNKTENYIDRVNFHVEKNLDNRFQPAIQPTMRLMGKDVAVGRSNEECLGFNDGKSWSGNELVTQNCPSITVSGKPFMKRWPQGESVEHAESVSSKENLFKSLEVPSSIYCMPATEFSSNPMHLDFQPQWLSRSSAIGSHDYNADLFFHSIPQQLLKRTSNSAVNCNSGTQHVKMGHQQPLMGPYPQNVGHHMLLNSTHCKHSQGVPYSMSTFHPAFPDQECMSLSQPSIAHSPPTLPHWLLNATHQKKIQQSSCPYSAPLSANQPSIIRGNNVFPFSSPYPAPIISFPFYGSNSLPGPASAVHHVAIPALGANKSRPAVTTSCRSKKKNNTSTKFEFANVKGLDRTNKTQKRPAANDDISMNTPKKANLNLQEGLNVPTDSERRKQMHGHSKCNIGSSEINSYGSKITDREPMLHLSNEKDSMVTTSGSSASNFDPQERSGFVKLSGGAKHMLKPCQNTDQDKSRPVHSTIPFAVGTTSDRELVSQSKASKVYRF